MYTLRDLCSSSGSSTSSYNATNDLFRYLYNPSALHEHKYCKKQTPPGLLVGQHSSIGPSFLVFLNNFVKANTHFIHFFAANIRLFGHFALLHVCYGCGCVVNVWTLGIKPLAKTLSNATMPEYARPVYI